MSLLPYPYTISMGWFNSPVACLILGTNLFLLLGTFWHWGQPLTQMQILTPIHMTWWLTFELREEIYRISRNRGTRRKLSVVYLWIIFPLPRHRFTAPFFKYSEFCTWPVIDLTCVRRLSAVKKLCVGRIHICAQMIRRKQSPIRAIHKSSPPYWIRLNT